MKNTLLVTLPLLFSFALILQTVADETVPSTIDENTPPEILLPLAENGDATAQYHLAIAYAYGKGVEPDTEQTFKWLSKSAGLGLAAAQFDLGVCYETGLGVAENLNEATQWYQKAVDQGLADAQFNLGVCYEHGKGVGQDASEAVRLYRLAAEQEFAPAMFNLAVAYKNGWGVPQDDREADRWLRKSAEQGFPAAQEILAGMEPLNRGARAEKFGEGLGQMTVTGYPIAMIIAWGFCTIRRWFTGKHYPFWRATGWCLMFVFTFYTALVVFLVLLIPSVSNANLPPNPLLFQVFSLGTPLFYGIGLGVCALTFLDVDWKNISFGQKIKTILAFIASTIAVMVVTVIFVAILFAVCVS